MKKPVLYHYIHGRVIRYLDNTTGKCMFEIAAENADIPTIGTSVHLSLLDGGKTNGKVVDVIYRYEETLHDWESIHVVDPVVLVMLDSIEMFG